MVLTTHYLEEAEELCDRVAIMDEARIVALDTPAGLIAALDADARVSYTDCGRRPHGLRARTRRRRCSRCSSGPARAATTVHNLAVKGADLEDVFLQLTGREYRE